MNPYSDYGSRYSAYSICNPYASDPPIVTDGEGGYYGRLTLNKYASDAITNSTIVAWLTGVCLSREEARRSRLPRPCVHDLSHAYATIALRTNPGKVAGTSRYLGHVDISITFRVCRHVLDSELKEAVVDCSRQDRIFPFRRSASSSRPRTGRATGVPKQSRNWTKSRTASMTRSLWWARPDSNR